MIGEKREVRDERGLPPEWEEMGRDSGAPSSVLRVVPCWTALFRTVPSNAPCPPCPSCPPCNSKFPNAPPLQIQSKLPNGTRRDSVKQRARQDQGARGRAAAKKPHPDNRHRHTPCAPRLPHLAIFNDYAEGWLAQEPSLVRI